jgi:hypothetical protein
LTVTASAGGVRYCCDSSEIEGIAIPIRISAGTMVQATSSSVLCVVREGTGLALARNRHIT